MCVFRNSCGICFEELQFSSSSFTKNTKKNIFLVSLWYVLFYFFSNIGVENYIEGNFPTINLKKMPNLLEILLALKPVASLPNIAKLSQIITTILRLSVPVRLHVSLVALGTYPPVPQNDFMPKNLCLGL